MKSYSKSLIVTVIIPLYNRSETILRTLNSVKDQIHRPIEIIIIDDGSTDDSGEIIKRWKNENNCNELSIVYIKQNNAGAPSARNKGLKLSTGKYIQFLDSDDTLEPEKIKNQIDILENIEHEIAICDFRFLYEKDKQVRIVKNDGELIKDMSNGKSIYTSTPLIKKNLLSTNNILWNENLTRNQDIDYLFKVLCVAKSYIYTPGVWCNYIIHSGGQISDEYLSTQPQYIKRIKGLCVFSYRLRRVLSLKSKKYMFEAVVRLVLSMMMYLIKKYLNINNINPKAKSIKY